MSVQTSGNPYHKRFTMVPNYLIRKLPVSFEARMMLIYLLSHDAGYLLRVTQICSETGKSRDAVQKIMRELENTGFLIRQQLRSDSGRITGTAYKINEDSIWGLDKDPHENPCAGNPICGDDQGEHEFSQVSPEPDSPALVGQLTKKTISEKTIEEDLPTPAASAHTAQTLLKTLIDACLAQPRPLVLTPRVKGMYGKKFKELLDGGIPPELILEALRLSWKKRTLDRVQLLDNYLIEVQAGPAAPMYTTAAERKQEKQAETKTLIQQATEMVTAAGGRSNDVKAIKKALAMLKEGIGGQMAIGAVAWAG